MGLNLGFETNDSLFPQGRDTGQGVGTREISQFIEEYVENKVIIFLSASEFGTTDTGTTGQDYFNALNFDGTNPETASGANFIIPQNWDGCQLKFTVYWSCGAAGAGDVYWKVNVYWCGEEETTNAHQTDSGSNLIDTKTTTSNLQMISWNTSDQAFKAGDLVGIRMDRIADDAADTLGGIDANFLGLKIEVVK